MTAKQLSRYDADNRLSAIRHQLSGAVLAQFKYTYDAVGNVLAVTNRKDF